MKSISCSYSEPATAVQFFAVRSGSVAVFFWPRELDSKTLAVNRYKRCKWKHVGWGQLIELGTSQGWWWGGTYRGTKLMTGASQGRKSVAGACWCWHGAGPATGACRGRNKVPLTALRLESWMECQKNLYAIIMVSNYNGRKYAVTMADVNCIT
jgi:hypothetical protein